MNYTKDNPPAIGDRVRAVYDCPACGKRHSGTVIGVYQYRSEPSGFAFVRWAGAGEGAPDFELIEPEEQA